MSHGPVSLYLVRLTVSLDSSVLRQKAAHGLSLANVRDNEAGVLCIHDDSSRFIESICLLQHPAVTYYVPPGIEVVSILEVIVACSATESFGVAFLPFRVVYLEFSVGNDSYLTATSVYTLDLAIL